MSTTKNRLVALAAATLAIGCLGCQSSGETTASPGIPPSGSEIGKPDVPSGTDSTGTDSTGTDSTGTDSTGTDSTGTDSTGTDSTGTDSTGTDSTGTDSTVRNCPCRVEHNGKEIYRYTYDSDGNLLTSAYGTSATVTEYSYEGNLQAPPLPDHQWWSALTVGNSTVHFLPHVMTHMNGLGFGWGVFPHSIGRIHPTCGPLLATKVGTTEIAYDNRGFPTAYANATTSLEYDNDGRIQKQTHESGKNIHTTKYDSEGRLVHIQFWFSPPATDGNLGVSYDTECSWITYPSASEVVATHAWCHRGPDDWIEQTTFRFSGEKLTNFSSVSYLGTTRTCSVEYDAHGRTHKVNCSDKVGEDNILLDYECLEEEIEE